MMDWFRRLFFPPTGSHPCCGEYARCQRACVPRGEWRERARTDRAVAALHTLYLETADYIERNNLGPVHHNQSMKAARDALAAEGRTIWYEKRPSQGKEK